MVAYKCSAHTKQKGQQIHYDLQCHISHQQFEIQPQFFCSTIFRSFISFAIEIKRDLPRFVRCIPNQKGKNALFRRKINWCAKVISTKEYTAKAANKQVLTAKSTKRDTTSAMTIHTSATNFQLRHIQTKNKNKMIWSARVCIGSQVLLPICVAFILLSCCFGLAHVYAVLFVRM